MVFTSPNLKLQKMTQNHENGEIGEPVDGFGG